MEPENILLSNRYELIERQGTGGMATVYRAHDRMLERTVAIKLLRKDLSSDPAFRQRFHREAKAAANLSHQNIVTIHDFGLHRDQLFIVMEYVPGTDLKTILQQRGRLNAEDSVALLIQACAGIGYAHRAGLVHCDIKPHNMLVTPDKRLKVVDFGIARALASISPDERSEVVWGSPQYFSPEQASGYPPSPASDVYSLGVVMYEMLTGKLPFNGKTAEELARLHRDAAPLPPRLFNPAIPETLERIVLKVLSKEPSARYRTADQMGRVLLTFSRPPSTPEAELQVPTSPSALTTVRTEGHPTTQPTQLPGITATPARPTKAITQKTRRTVPPTVAPEPAIPIDWATWLLALLAFLAVGGLIPFWLWIYYVLRPPV